MTKVLLSSCHECYNRCLNLVYIEDGKVVKIEGNPKGFNKGILCPKGTKAAIEWTYHKDRLLYPMKRKRGRGEGKWERITWRQALDLIAEEFGKIIHRYGPLSIAAMVSRVTAYQRGPAVWLMMRSIGSPNVMINHDLCSGQDNIACRATGLRRILGYTDIEKSKCLMILGHNIAESDFPMWQRVKKAVAKGMMKLIVVDPRRIPLVDDAALYLLSLIHISEPTRPY